MDEKDEATKSSTEASRRERNIKLAKLAAQDLIAYAEQGYHGEIVFHFKGGEVHQGDLMRTKKYRIIGE